MSINLDTNFADGSYADTLYSTLKLFEGEKFDAYQLNQVVVGCACAPLFALFLPNFLRIACGAAPHSSCKSVGVADTSRTTLQLNRLPIDRNLRLPAMHRFNARLQRLHLVEFAVNEK